MDDMKTKQRKYMPKESNPLNREGVETIDDLTEEERKERAKRFVFTAEDIEVVEEEDASN